MGSSAGKTAATTGASRHQAASVGECSSQFHKALMVPERLKFVAVDITNRKAETATMDWNYFAIGINHNLAKYIETAPPKGDFRLGVIDN